MSDQNRAGTCRSCGAAIVWARTRNGRLMPVDAEPSPEGGNCVLPGDGTVDVIDAWKPPAEGDPPRHTSHFATCPGAAGHRRK